MKEISKMKIYDEGFYLSFDFKGKTLNKIEEPKIDEEINKFMEEFTFRDMIYTIKELRNILKDFKEEILTITYMNKDGYEETVKLCCKQLYLYTTKRKTKNTTISLKYMPTSQIEFTVFDKDKNILTQENIFDNQQEIINIINDIYCLRDLEEEKVKVYTRK